MRRNIDGSCSGDPCCKPRNVRTINTMNPDDSGNFTVNAGDGIEVQTTTNGIRVSVKAPLPGPMVFRGTVGTGGTIATLPDANVENIGWTYVAISAGTTPDDTPKSYEIGDMLVSNGSEWIVIPAGDDPVDWSQIQNKPTTVAGYGITDAVDIGSAQNITGLKTIVTSSPEINLKTTAYALDDSNANYESFGCFHYKDKNNDTVHITRTDKLSDDKFRHLEELHKSISGVDNVARKSLLIDASGNKWSESPYRTYNASNISDVVTIGSLHASSDVVHTTGNEVVNGFKKFIDAIWVGGENAGESGRIYYETSGTNKRVAVRVDNTAANIGYLLLTMSSSGTLTLSLVKNINGVTSSATVATL